ncbi:hydratase [Ramlibacter sp. AN1015]|uniref:2-keto-4-pentenoate hydratase n=1 Tax=Ramlibacter sp. AN1015 TaxID=3133428 RepID=UPI0030BC6BC7
MRPDDILAALDSATLWPAGRGGASDTDLAAAYRCALAVRERRIRRGEKPVGYKIGFTNRIIWPRYNVWAPIWGVVWDSTLSFCDTEATLDLSGACQPRLEPEAVFGFREPPPPRPDMDQLFDCLEWVAPGFEVVQSHCPDWKFTAADTVADGGLHAHLVVGQRSPVRAIANDAAALARTLSACTVRLLCNGRLAEEGRGANVLDGPLQALHHFVHELAQLDGAPHIAAGDVVTTGTWTDAWPLQAGACWRAEFDSPLHSLQLRVR